MVRLAATGLLLRPSTQRLVARGDSLYVLQAETGRTLARGTVRSIEPGVFMFRYQTLEQSGCGAEARLVWPTDIEERQMLRVSAGVLSEAEQKRSSRSAFVVLFNPCGGF